MGLMGNFTVADAFKTPDFQTFQAGLVKRNGLGAAWRISAKAEMDAFALRLQATAIRPPSLSRVAQSRTQTKSFSAALTC